MEPSAFSLTRDLREMVCPAEIFNTLKKMDYQLLERLHTDAPHKITDEKNRALAVKTLLADLADPENLFGEEHIVYEPAELLATAVEYPEVLKTLLESGKITEEKFEPFLSAA